MKTTRCVIVLAAALAAGPASGQSKGSEDDKNHYILCDFKCVDAMPWVLTGKMNIARAGHTATLLADGKVLVVGGANGSPDAIDAAELYDPPSRSWTLTGRLNLARFADTATLLADGRVLVTGGFSHGGFTNTAEVYDPAKGAWTRTGNMSTVRAGHSATLLQDGRVLVAGGQGPGGRGAPQDCRDLRPRQRELESSARPEFRPHEAHRDPTARRAGLGCSGRVRR